MNGPGTPPDDARRFADFDVAGQNPGRPAADRIGPRADLSGANLSESDLSRSNFARANLHDANPTRAILRGAYFAGTHPGRPRTDSVPI